MWEYKFELFEKWNINLNYPEIAKVNSNTPKKNFKFVTPTAEWRRLFPRIYLPEILATIHARKALAVSADVHMFFNLCFLHRLSAGIARENNHVGERAAAPLKQARSFSPHRHSPRKTKRRALLLQLERSVQMVENRWTSKAGWLWTCKTLSGKSSFCLVSRAQVKPATLNPVTVKPVTLRIFSFVRKLYGCQTLLPTFNRKQKALTTTTGDSSWSSPLSFNSPTARLSPAPFPTRAGCSTPYPHHISPTSSPRPRAFLPAPSRSLGRRRFPVHPPNPPPQPPAPRLPGPPGQPAQGNCTCLRPPPRSRSGRSAPAPGAALGSLRPAPPSLRRGGSGKSGGGRGRGWRWDGAGWWPEPVRAGQGRASSVASGLRGAWGLRLRAGGWSWVPPGWGRARLRRCAGKWVWFICWFIYFKACWKAWLNRREKKSPTH